jgi:hypothetical protein
VERIYRLLFSRGPDGEEFRLAREYLAWSPSRDESLPWKYGYGAVDHTAQRVSHFAELRHWTGERWQAGPALPDPQLGWVFLDRVGGHPAATLDRCAIRRWTAPVAGTIEIAGLLKHVPAEGNGVRARIVSSHSGILGQWTVHHSEIAIDGIKTNVEQGDTIDFVVDFNGEILHDEHEWPVTIRLLPAGNASGSSVAAWDSQKDFRGGQADPWTNYVHALLMTNEFIFVD